MWKLVLAAMLVPGLAAARPTVAARAAFAPAIGGAAEHLSMDEAIGMQLPLQLDALWREGRLAAGAYASLALGRVSVAACTDGAECSGSAFRLGAQATWALPPPRGWPAPWIGGGLGWEWISWSRDRLGSETARGFAGPEAFLQGGAEWSLGARVALGPYALLAIGRYARASVETPVASASSDVGERAFHAWIHLGVRCRVDL